MTNVTLAQVAAYAGVSTTTTSRVLNKSGKNNQIKISKKTTQKVLAAAKELGYQQNLFAHLMKKKSSGVVGIILRNINDPLLTRLTEKIEQKLEKNGIATIIGHTSGDFSSIQKQIKFMLSNFFDGIVVIDYIPTNSELLAFLKEQETPYVVVTGSFSDAATPVVRTDDAKGIKKMVHQIQQKKFTTFAYYGNVQVGVTHRKQMYIASLKKIGIPGNDIFMLNSSSKPKFEKSLSQLMTQAKPIFLFCATDELALKIYLLLTKQGYSIPSDISLAGFDGLFLNQNSAIKIGSIVQPLDEIATKSVQILVDEIRKKTVIRQIVQIEPEFIKGETI